MSYVLLLAMAMLVPAQSAPAGVSNGESSPARPAANLELGEPISYGFAGVKLAMPKGFELQASASPISVVRAVRTKNDQPIMAVSLSAFLQKNDVALDDFVKSVQPGRDDLSVRNYRHLGTSSIKIAGINGKAVLVSYDYRSVPTKALMIYFLRPLNEKSQIGYLLTGEGDKDNFSTVFAATREVGDALQLIDFVHPGQEAITELTLPIESRANGYSIKVPPNWKFQVMNRERSQIRMYQVDYLQNGEPRPDIQFLVRPELNSAEVAAKVMLRAIEDNLAKGNQEYEVLRQEAVKMAGADGFGFLIKQRVPPQADGNPSYIMLLTRVVCLNGRSYAIVVVNDTEDANWMVSAMDRISGGLELSVPVTSMPTSLPGSGESASRPSRGSLRTTQPTSQPATDEAN